MAPPSSPLSAPSLLHCSYCNRLLALEPATVYIQPMGEKTGFPLCLRCTFSYAMRLAEGHTEALAIIQSMWQETRRQERRKARSRKRQ
jgi:hypothetical protein